MKSRLLAGVAAIVLALVGGLLVFMYVQSANARAVADLDPTPVLVVQESVPAGTPVEQLKALVATESLPAAAVTGKALKDLDSSNGKVTAVDLIAGEQLLADRLVEPEDAEPSGTIDIPKGLQEVSVQLEPQRVVGGQLKPGDHVGVFISMDSGALADNPEAATTKLVVHKALVTAVQGAPAGPAEGSETAASEGEDAAAPEGDEAAASVPTEPLIITIAVDDTNAARIIFAAEFATVWLSKEPKNATESAPEVIQKTEVYQ